MPNQRQGRVLLPPEVEGREFGRRRHGAARRPHEDHRWPGDGFDPSKPRVKLYYVKKVVI